MINILFVKMVRNRLFSRKSACIARNCKGAHRLAGDHSYE